MKICQVFLYPRVNMSRDRAFVVCREMLEQRGYTIIDTEIDRIIAQKQCGNQMIAVFIDAQKFDIGLMKESVGIMNDLSVTHAIIIFKDGVTSVTKKTVEQSLDLKMEFFALEDLQYNITKHRLQPKYDKLPDKEAEEFKSKYGLKFPVMRTVDPIARFYDYKKGDIIKVTRKSGYICFRIVRG